MAYLLCGGFPYEIMESPHYVPGNERNEFSRFKGKQLWTEIIQVTEYVCVLYAARVHTDFNAKVTKDCSRKAKAGVMCYFLQPQSRHDY